MKIRNPDKVVFRVFRPFNLVLLTEFICTKSQSHFQNPVNYLVWRFFAKKKIVNRFQPLSIFQKRFISASFTGFQTRLLIGLMSYSSFQEIFALRS